MTRLAFSADTRDLIRLLARHNVKYLLVGGVAVIYHGYARLTGDVDLFFEPTKANAKRLFGALREFWGGDVPHVGSAKDLLAKGVIIQFGTRPNRIDLMNRITGVTFKEAWSGRVVETISTRGGGSSLPIIGKAALKKNKRSLGRHKDLDDLQYIGTSTAKDHKKQLP